MLNLDSYEWFCLLLITVQFYCLAVIIRKGNSCRWDKQSRWVACRIVPCNIGMTSVTFLTGWLVRSEDGLLHWFLVGGFAAMTALWLWKIPSILDGMCDENVREKLNIPDND